MARTIIYCWSIHRNALYINSLKIRIENEWKKWIKIEEKKSINKDLNNVRDLQVKYFAVRHFDSFFFLNVQIY